MLLQLTHTSPETQAIVSPGNLTADETRDDAKEAIYAAVDHMMMQVVGSPRFSCHTVAIFTPDEM